LIDLGKLLQSNEPRDINAQRSPKDDVEQQ